MIILSFFILGITLIMDYIYGDSGLSYVELVLLDLIAETIIILPQGLVLRVYISRAGLWIPMTMLGVIVGLGGCSLGEQLAINLK